MLKNFRRRVLAQPALTIVLFAAVALPTAALADNLDFSTGMFMSGTWRVNSASNIGVTIVGSENTFVFNFTPPPTALVPVAQTNSPNFPPPANLPDRCMTPPRFFFCSDIVGGTLTIRNPAGQDIFTGTFDSGVLKEFVTPSPGNRGNLTIEAALGSGTCLGPLAPCMTDGGEVTLGVDKGANSFNMMTGNLSSGGSDAEDIETVPVSTPEPGSLTLLGIGMMGLAATARRKLRI